MYNGLVKHMSGVAKADFWARQKPRRETHTLITVELPLTVNGWMFMNQKEPGEVQIFYRFTAEDLAAYTSLTTNRSEFMNTCTSRDVCQ